jgi:hypothetical protein
VKDPDGAKVHEKYGHGVWTPAWTLLDADRKVLADSRRGEENVGFPYEQQEAAHFFDALGKACPAMGKESIKVLKERLEKHRAFRKAEIEARAGRGGQR